jgi:hypothetical protein
MQRAGAAMHCTRITWLAVTAGAAALALGCGEGRAIFNVDVLSFLGGQGNDTVHYTIPGGTSGTVDNPPVKVTVLKGLGNSTVDTATLTVAANVENLSGSGKVKFQIFLNSDAATLYNTTPYTEDSALVSGVQTVALAPGPVPLPVVAYSIFEQQEQWYVGVRLIVTADPPLAPPMDGKLRLTTVRLRIVLQENVF